MKQTFRLKISVLSVALLFCSVSVLAQHVEHGGKHVDDIANEEHHHDHDHSSPIHSHDDFNKYFLAVHGITLFNATNVLNDRFENPDGATKQWNATASLPLFATAFGFGITDKTKIFAKIEFEHGGIGGHQHAGEHGHEAHVGLEKSGAVVLERVYLLHKFSENFNLRIGKMPVPMGQMYLAHEPITYRATLQGRADGKVIPHEWQEIGFSLFGDITPAWGYQLYCVIGLDADYFSPENFVSEGKQSRFERNFYSTPAFVGRIDYKGIDNLNIGLTGYYGNTDLNTQDQTQPRRNISVTLAELSVVYKTNELHAVSNVILGNATNTEKLDTPIAQQAMAATVELGYNLNSKNPNNSLWLFGRVDYSNPIYKMPNGIVGDVRAKETAITGGINYFLNSSVAIKAEYFHRLVGNENINNEQGVSVGAVFSFAAVNK